jgi:beta-N-acetylhexosaminidase
MTIFLRCALTSYLFLLSCASVPKIQPVAKISKSWADNTLVDLSIRERIAQMMIYSMSMQFEKVSETKWEEVFTLIKSDGIGGVHLWYGEASSSITIMNQMQKESKIPILFDADLETGLKQRFPSGTEFPPAMAIGATGKPENAFEIGSIIAKEARSVGLHWNFSPVVDVNNNALNPIINIRSFGEKPEFVSKYGIQLIKGLQEGGMLATAKHFPGHGDTETDSHSSLAMIPSDSLRLWETELKPFKAMIDHNVDAIMVAHIHAPDYQKDSDRPASMSSFWIEDILKSRMNFKGTVVTDAMEMGGIVKNYSDDFALIETIKAGANVIIQNHNFKRSIDVVEQAVVNGEIPIEIVNKSALKMLKMKQKIGLDQNRYVDINNMQKTLGKNSHKKIAQKVASEAVTCVKNKGNLIPFNIDEKDSLYVIDLYDSKNNHSISSVSKRLKKNGLKVKFYQYDDSDSKRYMKLILSEIPKDARILINAFVNPKASKNQIFFSEFQSDFIEKIIEKSNRVTMASLGSPYLIQQFEDIPAYICAYKNSDLMQHALAEALSGKKKISGTLPISIPNIASFGQGLIIKKDKQHRSKTKIYKSGEKIIKIRPGEIKANVDLTRSLLNESIKQKAWPGCVLLGAKDGKIFIHEAVGYHTYDKKRKTRASDIFDIASITKVIATTSGIMKLYDEDLLKLKSPVIDYIPKFKGTKNKYKAIKSKITVHDLLTHTSGLPAFKAYHTINESIEKKFDSIYNTVPIASPGDTMIYSDIGAIILGKIVEKISGVSLDQYVDSLIFLPLGMKATTYNPKSEKRHRIVPTEIDDSGLLIKGVVHDENARGLNGVAGHAGLFSTAKDLSLFSQMMLNKGIYGWTRIFKSETVNLFTQKSPNQSNISRAMGWDTPSGYSSGGVYLSDSSFGHTGFTGTSLWIDPENKMIVILLSNSVHPNRKHKNPNYYDWRQRIHSSVYESIGINEKKTNLEWRKSW